MKKTPINIPVQADTLQLAVDHHRDGRLIEAEHLYRLILQATPAHGDVNHNLGTLLIGRGMSQQSLLYFKAALGANSQNGQYWLSYINALIVVGNISEARSALISIKKRGLVGPEVDALEARIREVAIDSADLDSKLRDSNVSPALQLVKATQSVPLWDTSIKSIGSVLWTSKMLSNAGAHYQAGRLKPAEALYLQVISLDQKVAKAHHMLGVIALQTGRLEYALEELRQAVELNTGVAEFQFNLATALCLKGSMDEAVPHYESALKIKPDFLPAVFNLGNTFKTLGKWKEAVAQYEQVIALKPDSADALCFLGESLQRMGSVAEAEIRYKQALAIDPLLLEALLNFGYIRQTKGDLEVAVSCFQKALSNQPSCLPALCNLIDSLNSLGRLEEATKYADSLLETQSIPFEYDFRLKLSLPPILPSVAAIDECRDRFQTGLAALTARQSSIEAPHRNLSPSTFFLAYHNRDDRPLMDAMCTMMRSKCPELNYSAPELKSWTRPEDGSRIRVGVLSAYLSGHTIGKLYQGFIRHLDRSKFEVVVIHLQSSKQDSYRTEIDRLADDVITLPNGLFQQQRKIAELALDVLFYPDIGMSPETYFLAYARLAPVQVVSWGHPDTSGLDSIDYFLSAQSIEPPNADSLYSERLIQLTRLPCLYQPLMPLDQILDRTALGLPPTGTLYGCPQTLFKIHPDFDAVLAEIARGDPDCHIVLLEGKIPSWVEQLRSRWAVKYPSLTSRVVFLPSQPLDRFMAMMAHFDVLLDPIHFGSGNTLYEAMVYGTPVVTWPGQFMRGRIVAGAYQQLGIADAPVADTLGDYAAIALTLGKNPDIRRQLREATLAAKLELLGDHKAVRELEVFLLEAVLAAGRQERLPIGWQPKFTEEGSA